MKHIAIIGASGGIGAAFIESLLKRDETQRIYAFSRSGSDFTDERVENLDIDITSADSVEGASQHINAPLDLVIIATGLLHDGDKMQPEKSIRNIERDNFEASYLVNTIGPALVGKYFLPKMNKDGRAVFAALSARVGSISDNEVGGWYAYRASKAALNMVLKNFAIEMGRRHKELVIAALQPGTVDTDLSKPFQGNVANDKLFTPAYSAEKLLDVLAGIDPQNSGKLFDWAGSIIDP